MTRLEAILPNTVLRGILPDAAVTVVNVQWYGSDAVELTYKTETRVGRDAGRIAEEVIAHLAILPGADVKITLEIEGNFPDGVPDAVVRTVLENSRTLHFNPNPGFDKE